jgi:uncharacterized membrane protein YsdA (DUF1294 family)
MQWRSTAGATNGLLSIGAPLYDNRKRSRSPIINELFIALVILYALGNGIAFISFALDKGFAVKNHRRLSERSLMIAAAAGPFGAYLSMKIFRHKTRRFKFYLVPAFLLMHIVVIAALLTRYYPRIP